MSWGGRYSKHGLFRIDPIPSSKPPARKRDKATTALASECCTYTPLFKVAAPYEMSYNKCQLPSPMTRWLELIQKVRSRHQGTPEVLNRHSRLSFRLCGERCAKVRQWFTHATICLYVHRLPVSRYTVIYIGSVVFHFSILQPSISSPVPSLSCTPLTFRRCEVAKMEPG